MLDIKWIRENSAALDEALRNRGSEPAADRLIELDEARRTHIAALQEAQERRNAASKEIGNAMRNGEMERAERLKGEVAEIKGFIQSGEEEQRRLERALQDALAQLPNVPLPDVPVGPDESANVVVATHGEPASPGHVKEHYELGEALGLMDFETAAKLAGSRFTVLKGALARMERALGQFMLDLHTQEHGYMEVQPPLLVTDDILFGTGQLPKFYEDQFVAYSGGDLEAERTGSGQYVGRVVTKDLPDPDRRWLIPTAEVPLTNLVREQILDASALPLRMTALTPCFRSEAGSAGRDTRGMLRQHQFNKVELVSITDAESSAAELERMTACASEVLKRLGLPFRTVLLSTGDMGFGARKTYDLEVWLPGQGAYREISSCSLCGDFQARRMQARYRREAGKQPIHVHTLNGSGVAVGRALIAVMENYQNADGSITVPDVLRPYMAGLERISAKE